MSDFVSLKEMFGSVEFKDRVKEGKAEKDRQRAAYIPEMWEELKDKLDRQNFPEYFFDPAARPRKDFGFEGHKHEGQMHSVLSYEHNIRHDWNFETEWRFVYCPSCGKVIHKLGALLNKVENLAYTRWFVRNGKDEIREAVPIKNPMVLDMSSTLPSSFESVLKI